MNVGLIIGLACLGSLSALGDEKNPVREADTLAFRATGSIDRLIAGRGRGELALFSDWSDAERAPVPNPDCWASEVDLGFVSVREDDGRGWVRDGCALLLTARHISMATHNAYPAGCRIQFVTSRGGSTAVVVRTVEKVVGIEGTDVSIGRLSEAIPAECVKPAVLLTPRDVHQRLGAFAPADPHRRRPLPLLCLNRDRSATIQLLAGVREHVVLAAPGAVGKVAESYAPFFVQPISGTSGCPILLLVDGRPILLSHYSTAKPETGPDYGALAPRIEETIRAMGDSESVSFADLSRYPASDFPVLLSQ